MSEKKITRHNHPIMVEARKEAYMKGYRDGREDGVQKGYERAAIHLAEIHRMEIIHLRGIIERLLKEKGGGENE